MSLRTSDRQVALWCRAPLWPAGSAAVHVAVGEGGVTCDCGASSDARALRHRGSPGCAHVCGRALCGAGSSVWVSLSPLSPPPSPAGTRRLFPVWVAMEQALRSLARRAVGLPSAACSRCFAAGPTRDKRPSRLCQAAARGGDGARTFRGDLHAAREGWGSPGREASKGRRRPEGRPLPIERTRGTEILFGVAPCSMALSQARRDLFRLFLKRSGGPQRLITSEFVLQAAARGVPVLHVGRRELDVLCGGRVHQGVCLEATPLRFKSLEEAEEPGLGNGESLNRRLLWLVLEQIQDPMNLGAVLRSAYFLGVDRVVTSQRNSCPLTPTVSKASSGAMEVFDVYSTDDLRSFLKAKAAEGWEVVGTVSQSEAVENVPVISCSEFQWNKPIILVIAKL
ncbi:dehydrogenase/reductase SDR family member 11 isoform X2 [Numida meleagris]|uniref:dehydrogenase/reductase SDR family member 11 isoform X2 n=1 Tax=Numida meleagris TaxID=8996 RepID=UPI000B3DE89F|nr:dehydrogenase/reductase SDR family member 11 isoform X2 [Numida meleagris]